MSAGVFFDQVDVNKDGQITEAEFVDFWCIVKQSGHGEEEILEELD